MVILAWISEGQQIEPCLFNYFFSSLDLSEISKGSRVNSFGKFPQGEGLNRLRKFTGQGTCSHIHSEVFLGNLRCFWDSVYICLNEFGGTCSG
jgi:hypothetical protein